MGLASCVPCSLATVSGLGVHLAPLSQQNLPWACCHLLSSWSWESECGLTAAVFPATCGLSAEVVSLSQRRGEDGANEVCLQAYGVTLTAFRTP